MGNAKLRLLSISFSISLVIFLFSATFVASAASVDWNFGAAGDWAGGTNAKNTATNMNTRGVEVTIGLGDYAYSSGTSAVDSWWNLISPVNNRFKGALGNHDAGDAVAYAGKFGVPTNLEYGYTFNNIRFVFINTEAGAFCTTCSQYLLIKSEFDSAQADPAIDWIIPVMHKPLYTSTSSHPPSESGQTPTLHALFDNYSKIKLVLAGHNHNYQRTYPLTCNPDSTGKCIVSSPVITDNVNKVNYVNPSGQIYVIVGTGGQNSYSLSSAPSYTLKQFTNDFGYLDVQVTDNGQKLTGIYYSNNGASTNTDLFTISKSASTVPSVTITHSPTNPSVNNVITLSASGTGASGLKTIEIFVDGSQANVCNVSGTSATCQAAAQYSTAGTHTYSARVTDSINQVANSNTVSFTVTQPQQFDFSISLSKSSASINQGQTTSATVNANLVSGTTQSVSFSCSGLPAGASCSFSSNSCSPTCASTLTIFSGTASLGTYPITISASGGSISKSSTLTLDITQTPIPIDNSPTSAVSHSPFTPTVGETVSFTATGTDDIGLSSIEIFVDSASVGSCATSAKSATCTKTATYSAAGTHSYYAKSTDTKVQTTQSSTSSFTVQSTLQTTQTPVLGTFYYMWYGAQANGWKHWKDPGANGNSHTPPNSWYSNYIPDLDSSKFDPLTELYDSNDASTVLWQIGMMKRAGIHFAVASWWGKGDGTNTPIDPYPDNVFRKILLNYMKRSDNPYPELLWTIYYEKEGFKDPSEAEITNDLNYIVSNYCSDPNYFKINGRCVIMVYSGGNDGAGMVTRWSNVRNSLGNVYIVLKVFSGYQTYASSVDGWHQFAPANRFEEHLPYSAYVSPGFTRPDDTATTFLARDLNAFANAVSQLNKSTARLKFIETWNELHEGNQVEPAQEINHNDGGTFTAKSNSYGTSYLDVIRNYFSPLGSAPIIPVPPPVEVFDFGISLSSGSASVVQGQSASTTASTTLTSGTTQPVSFSCSGLPSGSSCGFSQNSCSPTCTSAVTISSGTASTGTYTVNVAGSSGSSTKMSPMKLTITSVPTPPPTPTPFDFSLSLSSGSATVTQGRSVKTTATATLVSGTTKSVTFSCSGLPTGASCKFRPSSCSSLPCASAVTISSGSAAPGTYPITVNAVAGSLTKSFTFTLAISVKETHTRKISSTLTTENLDPVSATVNLLSGSTIVSSTQTDSSGYFSLLTQPGTYDLRFEPDAFYLSNYYLTFSAVNVSEDSDNILLRLSGDSVLKRVLFSAILQEPTLIKSYSPTKPFQITVDGVVLQEASSLSGIEINTWYYDDTNKILYMRIDRD